MVVVAWVLVVEVTVGMVSSTVYSVVIVLVSLQEVINVKQRILIKNTNFFKAKNPP